MRIPAWFLVWVLSVLAPQAAAQSPADLGDSDLLKRAAGGAAAVQKLADAFEADRKALSEGSGDLDRARAATRPSSESKPAIREPNSLDEEAVRALAAAQAEAEAAAASRSKGMTTLLSLLEARAALLRAARDRTNEIDQAAATLRPLLAELKRRIEAGKIAPESAVIGDRRLDPVAWTDRAERAVADAVAARGSLESELAAIPAERERIAAAPGEPKDTPEIRLQMMVEVLARSLAIEKNEREELRKSESDFAALVTRIDADWKADLGRLGAARSRVAALAAELDRIDDARKRLAPPQAETIPEGAGHVELRAARRAAALSEQLVAWHEHRIELGAAAQRIAGELRIELDKAGALFDGVLRSAGRLRAMAGHAEEMRAAGKPASATLPADVTAEAIWSKLRELAGVETNRRVQLAALDARIAKTDTDAQEAVVAERLQLKRLQAALAEEESYGRYLDEMGALGEADLLKRLAPDGPIETAIREKEAQLAAIDEAVTAAERTVRSQRDLIGAFENPYTELGIRRNAARAEEIRREVEGLKDGKVPADRSTLILGTLPDEAPGNPARHEGDVSAEKLKEQIETEQAFAKEISNYFSDLKKAVSAWKDGLAALDVSAEKKVSLLGDLVNERKRRYAAARELERRQSAGKVSANDVPRDFAKLLTRDEIAAASTKHDEALQRHETRRARHLADLKALEEVTGIEACTEMRSAAADRKASIIAQPLRHLAAARTPYEDLPELERNKLGYAAEMRKAGEGTAIDRIIGAITPRDTREQFERPLKALYLELVTSERAASEFQAGSAAYEHLIEVSISERENLRCMPDALRDREALRVFQYHTARHLAAIAGSPDKKVDIESAFKATYKKDLAIPADDWGWSKLAWAGNLFAAEMRLWGHRRWLLESEVIISKLGNEADIARFRKQIAKITSEREVEEARRVSLAGSIQSLRSSYRDTARRDAIEALVAVLAIIIAARLLVSLVRRVRKRILARTDVAIAPDESDRRRRLQTITRVASTVVIGIIWTLAGIYVLGGLGVDVTPILASAGVAGIALAFGAQTLVRDFLSGFFILIENQYTIGDVIDVGGAAGVVESITLRVTVLRDQEGVVHYVPNGTLTRVSNKTQGWSRSIVEVGVGYGEDIERVTDVLKETLQTMRDEMPWKYLILEEPQVLGVDRLADSSINLQVAVKCRPGKQWDLSRELRKRIKQSFDAAKISIPYPQRVIHHVWENGRPPDGRGPGAPPPEVS